MKLDAKSRKVKLPDRVAQRGALPALGNVSVVALSSVVAAYFFMIVFHWLTLSAQAGSGEPASSSAAFSPNGYGFTTWPATSGSGLPTGIA